MKPSEDANILTLDALLSNPKNESVMRYMGICGPEDVSYFASATDGSPFDEGAGIFFHQYGGQLPDSTYCSVNTFNLIAHERTATIFAFHEGHLTIALRPDKKGDALMECFISSLKGETLDGRVDLSGLGSGWVLFGADCDEDAQSAFVEAYTLAGLSDED